MQRLASMWMEGSTTEMTRGGVKAKIDDFVKGDLERASEILCDLLEFEIRDNDAPTLVLTPMAS